MFHALLSCLFLISVTVPVYSNNSTEETHMKINNENSTAEVPGEPLSQSIAEKYIRYRRQPFTIVKHVSRATKRSKHRRRYKAPKIKYGPPNYISGEPIIYKQYHQSSSLAEPPSISLDQYQHLSLDGPDFKVPPSSYEGQSMNLNFYHQEDTQSYDPPKSSSIEYSYEPETQEYPTAYEESNVQRVPHQKYGVPQEQHYSTGYKTIPENLYDPKPSHSGDQYGTPETYVSNHYQHSPSAIEPTDYYSHHQPHAAPSQPSDYSSKHQSYAPATTYHTSNSQYDSSAPDAPPTHYAPPTQDNSNSYVAYEKKIPNVSFSKVQQSFAEPPTHTPDSKYEIAYAPPGYKSSSSSSSSSSYPSSHEYPNSNSFQQTSQTYTHSGGFNADQTSQHAPQPPEAPTNPQYEDYSLPTQELPLNPNHKFPTYDYPKSSYEVPIYDPIPFEASNTEEQEAYPPNNDVTATQDHNFAAPIYNVEQPRPTDVAADGYTSGSAKAPTTDQIPHQSSRKRKRVRGRDNPVIPSMKHTLDVPELKAAFELEKHSKPSNDADVNESHYIENKRTFQNSVPTSSLRPPLIAVSSSETFVNHAWNPMRVRTNPTTNAIFVPTIVPTTTTTKSEQNLSQTKQRLLPNQRNRPPSMHPITEHPLVSTKPMTTRQTNRRPGTSTSDISIEKSHSKSYYDGTIAPPTIREYENLSSRSTRYHISSRPRHEATTSFRREPMHSSGLKRTTKSVFDTTHFKSPRNDKENEHQLKLLNQNLPKNHKLY